MVTPRAADGEDPPLWFARLRWRLRGESAKVGFVLAVGIDTLLLILLPVRGDGTPLGWAVGVAVAVNLLCVVVAAAAGSWFLRRRDPSLPRMVASDRAAVYLMALAACGFAVGGIVHRPALTAERAKQQAVVNEGMRFAERHAPDTVDVRRSSIDVRRWSTNVFRVCFPTEKPTRAWCVIVRPNRIKARAKRDDDTRPNSQAGGTAGPRPASGKR